MTFNGREFAGDLIGGILAVVGLGATCFLGWESVAHAHAPHYVLFGGAIGLLAVGCAMTAKEVFTTALLAIVNIAGLAWAKFRNPTSTPDAPAAPAEQRTFAGAVKRAAITTGLIKSVTREEALAAKQAPEERG